MRRPALLTLLAVPVLAGAIVLAVRARAVAHAGPEPSAEDDATGELEIDSTQNESELHALAPSLGSAAAILEPLPSADGGADAGTDAGGFLEHPEALDGFYRRVADLLSGAPGVVRVAHYGDSLITSDYLSGTARRLMQRDLGDGGHGFLAIANPWEWYFHNDVSHVASSGWRQSRITGPLARDKSYGPGGVVFRGSAGATAVFGTAKEGPFGRKVSRFHVLYQAQEGGGSFELKSGERTVTVATAEAERRPRSALFEVEDGEAKMSLRVLSGEVKLYGVALERERGLVYDALGVLGARAKMWQAVDETHMRAIYNERAPALIAVQFGTNETEFGPVDAGYPEMLRDLLGRWQRAAPEASFVLVAPPDRAVRSPNGELRSHRPLQKLVDLQREVATELGIAFFDTPAAMGGDGAMPRWVQAKLGSTDLIHPLPAGGERLGQLFVHGLASGYAIWRQRQPKAPEWVRKGAP